MNFDQAIEETDMRMQESVKRVQLQMEEMQIAHQKLISDSIAKMESYINKSEEAIVPEAKAEYVTTDNGEEMLVMNMAAAEQIKNTFTLMQEFVDELSKELN